MTYARFYCDRPAGLRPAIRQTGSLRYAAQVLGFLVLCRALWPGPILAQNTNAPASLTAYQKAETELKAHPQDEKAGWEFGRACFDLAEATSDKKQKEKLAERGVAACRNALQQNTNSAPAHYYLGLNLGEIASTRGLSALKLIKEMEGEMLITAGLDPKFDYAGPERTLGMLYRDAPSFGSIGSKSKARRELMHAVELMPDYPDNYFELIEGYLKWGEAQNARLQLKALEDHWTEAHKQLTGPQWENQWREWNAQLQKVKTRLGEPSGPEPSRQS